ncbi:MAG TPA: MBL fold metallo-hydrolase [Acidothermaceae bacterium]
METPALQIDRVEGDVMSVNSYLVHGPDGIVVVDAQLTVSDARKVRAAVDNTGKPLAGVVVTHAHPDHYAGAAILLAGLEVPLVSTQAVAGIIRRDDATKNDVVGPMMGQEWPEVRRFPDHLVASGDAIELGGIRLVAEDMGPGESPADSVWSIGDHSLFIGDLAYHGMHAYLADGFGREWLQTLRRLDEMLPADAVLYVGHGEPAGKELLDGQRRYVETFLAAVDEYRDEPEAARQLAVVAWMHELEPSDRLQFLMELSIEPVARAHVV